MFEKAAIMKLRFFVRGTVTVEDLWDLDVEELDGLYKRLMEDQRTTVGNTLLPTEGGAKKGCVVALSIDIVKHIVETKLNEKKERLDSASKQLQKQRIQEIIASKKDGDLAEKSIEELEKMIE